MKLRIRSIFFKLVCPVILVLGISAIVLVLGLVKIVSTKLDRKSTRLNSSHTS